MGSAMMIQIHLFINNNKKVGKSQHMEAIEGGKTANYKKTNIFSEE